MDATIENEQYSHFEIDKTDPYYSTIKKITKAMGYSLFEQFFNTGEEIKEIHFLDQPLIEKMTIVETLDE